MSTIAAGPLAALLDLDAPAVLFATAAQEPIDRTCAIVLARRWPALTPAGWWCVVVLAAVMAVCADVRILAM
jgi:hypothetical protein